MALGGAAPAFGQSVEELKNLSIDELANIEITSVAKRPETLSKAPAAIYVITGDEIRASGATSLPEALRLAPNLDVAQINSQTYTISARGFNSANASDKLLVLIDGRSIYSPFFNSVIWDQHQVMLDDVDRIEVISGPGGTLWGANAVNGVINIITKSSRDTQGGLVDVQGGNYEGGGAGRWGGKFGEYGTYRVYAMGEDSGNTETKGVSDQDSWSTRQTGFRSDWSAPFDEVTVQGDLFEDPFDSGGRSDGGNVLGRWTRKLDDGASLQLQTYYDRADQHPTDGVQDDLNTFDVELEENAPLGRVQQLVWGIGQRLWSDRFTPINAAIIVPGNESIALTNVFIQDTITLTPGLELTLGSKLEYNSLSGVEPLPSIRIGWQIDARDLVWAAISRAAETPSRIDRDLVIPVAPGLTFGPSPQYDAETLVAYETGYRTRFGDRASLSVSLFYNDYTNIRTTSLTGGTPTVIFKNGLEGNTFGAEFWGDYQALSWWKLSAGASFLHKDLHPEDGITDIAGIQTAAGIDPAHQIFLRSFMQLPHHLSLYVGGRHIASLGLAGVPAYYEADARIAWQVSASLELSLTGHNLVHAHHLEANDGDGNTPSIPRSVLAGLRKTF